MARRGKIWKKVLAAVFLLAVAGVVVLLWSFPALERALVSRHMRGVTYYLANWAEEYSQIHSDTNAFQSVEMLGYIETHYTPGEGYRGNPESEEILEKQRVLTLRKIIAALEKYAGESFGTNREKWEAWAESKGHKLVRLD